jgi:acetyl esterase
VKTLEGLPDATIITAQYDQLHDEGVDYANALRVVGVDAKLTDYEGMAHAFNGLLGIFDAARAAVDEASRRILASSAMPSPLGASL